MKNIIFTITAVLFFAVAAIAQGGGQGGKTSFKDKRDGQVYGIKKVGAAGYAVAVRCVQ